MKNEVIAHLDATRKATKKILQAFPEDQGGYRPTEEMMTVAGQIYHIARSDAWMLNGLTGKGWDFSIFHQAHSDDLKTALSYLDETRAKILDYINNASEQELLKFVEDASFCPSK